MQEKDVSQKLNELEQAINEAENSGTHYRPEHGGYDLAIDAAQVEPLIELLDSIFSDQAMKSSLSSRFEELRRRRELLLKRKDIS